MSPLDSEGRSIDSTNLYQGVNIPVFENESIARIVRTGGPDQASRVVLSVNQLSAISAGT